MCGVVTREAIETAAAVEPSTWTGDFAPLTDRVRSLGDSCTVDLSTGGEVLIVTREAESAERLDRLRSSLDAQPRCDRVERLKPSGWLCQTSALLTVQSTTEKRRVSFTFSGGAGRDLTTSQAEALVRAVDEGLDEFDATTAG